MRRKVSIKFGNSVLTGELNRALSMKVCWGQKSAYRRWESEATKTRSKVTYREFGKEERQRAGVEVVHGMREDFVGWFLFCLALGRRMVVMVFTLLSLPIATKRKTSPIDKKPNCLL